VRQLIWRGGIQGHTRCREPLAFSPVLDVGFAGRPSEPNSPGGSRRLRLCLYYFHYCIFLPKHNVLLLVFQRFRWPLLGLQQQGPWVGE
jgi:hypothetical protein